jgi:hypothetical protein
VHGRVGMRDAFPQFWIWTVVIFVAFGVVYWYVAERALERQKAAVMAKQRAHSVELGSRLVPFRDRVEGWVLKLAGPWKGNEVSPDLDLARLRRSKGTYLRLELGQATSAEQIREAAQRSLHDGFTSCLFERQGKFNTTDAKRCQHGFECPAGELCNEWNVCARPGQPFNLRLMYRALRVLSPKWTDELHQATSDYQVRVFERDLGNVTKNDVPIAVDLLTSAKYFTVLIDELPESGLPKVAGVNDDGGIRETPLTQLQTISHWVRLGIWELESGTQLVRMRTRADAKFVPVGAAGALSAESLRAQQRQVNNCSIAESLRDEVRARAVSAPTPGAAVPPFSGPSSEVGVRPPGSSGTRAPTPSASAE